MAKDGDIAYLKNIGNEGTISAANKPFSEAVCGKLLIDMGTIFSLLPPPPARLLDVGCGTGWTSCFFAKRGYIVTGQDIAPDMIEQANINKEKERLSHARFLVSDYESMTFGDEFDCAVFYDSLHHAVDETAALTKVYQALKPGGICITCEPGKGHEKKPYTIEAIKKYNVTERDMPPSRIIKAARKAGFSGFKVYPRLIHINKALSAEFNHPVIKIPFKFNAVRNMAVFIISAFLRNQQGIVVLTK